MTNRGSAAWTVWGSLWGLWEGGGGIAGWPLGGLASDCLSGKPSWPLQRQDAEAALSSPKPVCRGRLGVGSHLQPLKRAFVLLRVFMWEVGAVGPPPKIDMETSLDNVGLGSLRKSLSHSPYQRKKLLYRRGHWVPNLLPCAPPTPT